jgi:hypothetical protein
MTTVHAPERPFMPWSDRSFLSGDAAPPVCRRFCAWAARERARAESKSLNEVAVEALVDGLGLGDEDVVRRDLSDVAGTWKKDAAVRA